jgi:DNA-binding NarL/FixJ family response regulator
MDRIRVFLADDHELVRYALLTLLDDEPDIEVVGEAYDTDSVVAGCVETKPRVLVLDLHMPGGGGVEVCRRVRDEVPEAQVLVLTSFDEDEDVFGAVEAGASGYLLKETRPDQVVNAIRSISDGQAVFDSTIATRVLAGGRNGTVTLDGDPLSEREMEVLKLMAKGMSNKEIGRELWIGETTVKTHVSHILRKMGQADRTQAVLAAVKAGLVRLEE